MRLTGVRLPIDWGLLGFPASWDAAGTVLSDGEVAWSWEGEPPDFGVATFVPPAVATVDGWSVDHVVLLVPDMEVALAELQAGGADLRLRMDVRGRATSFFRVGTILEVIETGVPAPKLYGVALVTSEALLDVVLRWRDAGHDVSDPRPAIQPNREIFTVRSAAAGLAVMSPDGAA